MPVTIRVIADTAAAKEGIRELHQMIEKIGRTGGARGVEVTFDNAAKGAERASVSVGKYGKSTVQTRQQIKALVNDVERKIKAVTKGESAIASTSTEHLKFYRILKNQVSKQLRSLNDDFISGRKAPKEYAEEVADLTRSTLVLEDKIDNLTATKRKDAAITREAIKAQSKHDDALEKSISPIQQAITKKRQLDEQVEDGLITQRSFIYQVESLAQKNFPGLTLATLKQSTATEAYTGDTQQLVKALLSKNKAMKSTANQQLHMGRQTSRNSIALLDMSRIVEDSAFGIRGMANNIVPMITSFRLATAEAGGFTKGIASMAKSFIGINGIIVLISLITTLMITMGDKFKDLFSTAEQKRIKEMKDRLKELKEEVESLKKSTRELDIGHAFRVAIADVRALEAEVATFVQQVNTEFEKLNLVGKTRLAAGQVLSDITFGLFGKLDRSFAPGLSSLLTATQGVGVTQQQKETTEEKARLEFKKQNLELDKELESIGIERFHRINETQEVRLKEIELQTAINRRIDLENQARANGWEEEQEWNNLRQRMLSDEKGIRQEIVFEIRKAAEEAEEAAKKQEVELTKMEELVASLRERNVRAGVFDIDALEVAQGHFDDMRNTMVQMILAGETIPQGLVEGAAALERQLVTMAALQGMAAGHASGQPLSAGDSIDDTQLETGPWFTRESSVQTMDAVFTAAQAGIQLIASLQDNAHIQRMNALHRERDAELDIVDDQLKNVRLTKSARENLGREREKILDRYAEKEKEIERKQAQANRQLAIFDIITNTARAVVAALTSTPPNIPLSIAVGAIGAAQLAVAAGAPIPEFREGVTAEPLSGGFARVHQDELLINLSTRY